MKMSFSIFNFRANRQQNEAFIEFARIFFLKYFKYFLNMYIQNILFFCANIFCYHRYHCQNICRHVPKRVDFWAYIFVSVDENLSKRVDFWTFLFVSVDSNGKHFERKTFLFVSVDSNGKHFERKTFLLVYECQPD